MAVEIERKFLVKEDFSVWKHKNSIYFSEVNILQGYFHGDRVRVRVTSNGPYEEFTRGFLTIKGETEGCSRLEFEYDIPVEDACKMMKKFCKYSIDKTRYIFNEDGNGWEVDIFKGENSGLRVAEIELESEDQEIVLPEWIGKEVTDDDRYYNCNLAKNPYKNWKNSGETE